jgi:peptidoglycan lytic transglycosylase
MLKNMNRNYGRSVNVNFKGGLRMLKKTYILAVTFLILSMGAIPVYAAAIHNIRGGDTLYKIALNNRITVNKLKQANGLQRDVIYPGGKLEIPNESKTSSTNYQNHDIDLLARLITAEAGNEPFKGQVAVGSVIINRLSDAKFPETIAGNIFKPHQFESVSNGLIWQQPTENSYKAAKAALKGWDPTYGSKYFFNPAKINGPSWVWTRTIVERIGHHVFGV